VLKAAGDRWFRAASLLVNFNLVILVILFLIILSFGSSNCDNTTLGRLPQRRVGEEQLADCSIIDTRQQVTNGLRKADGARAARSRKSVIVLCARRGVALHCRRAPASPTDAGRQRGSTPHAGRRTTNAPAQVSVNDLANDSFLPPRHHNSNHTARTGRTAARARDVELLSGRAFNGSRNAALRARTRPFVICWDGHRRARARSDLEGFRVES
jgi:hypothetical protein